ncbi:hypothetical protein Btru_021158 [Bulinus truncatus]|nr:hypothetical protein Btru_021158 [Bulinus truncatus]
MAPVSTTPGLVKNPTSLRVTVSNRWYADQWCSAGNSYGVSSNPCFFWDSSISFQDHCYKLFNFSKTWAEAHSYCQQDIPRGKLMEVVDDNVIDYLSFHFPLAGQEWWTGGLKNVTYAANPMWVSSYQTIRSSRVSLSGNGDCVKLWDRQMKVASPVLDYEKCTNSKQFICQLFGKIYMSAYSTLYLEDEGISNRDEISFNIKFTNCGNNIRVLLWASDTNSSTPSSSQFDYYELNYDLLGGKDSTLRFCNNTMSTELARVKLTANCSKTLDSTIKWNTTTNIIKVAAFNNALSNIIPNINRISISMGNMSGIVSFQGLLATSDIFLGGNDSLHEGQLTWMSNDQNVTIADWKKDEPNDWSGVLGEDNLGWRVQSGVYQLNDFMGHSNMLGLFVKKVDISFYSVYFRFKGNYLELVVPIMK